MFAVAASNVNGGLVSFFHGVQVAIMFALMTNILQFAWWKVKGKKGLSHWKKNRPLYLLFLAMLLVCTQPVCMLVIGSWESMPNFFFDGGDTGSKCTLGSECGSKACEIDPTTMPQINYQLINNTWQGTGCTTETPQWAYMAYNGQAPADTRQAAVMDGGAAAIFKDYCNSNDISADFMLTVEYQTCKPDPKKGCKQMPKVDDPLVCATGDMTCACAMDSNALFPNTNIGWCIQIFGTYGGFIFMFCGVFEATNLHKKIISKWKNLR